MNDFKILQRLTGALMLAILVTGCTKHEHSEHDREDQTSVATYGFKEGRGVFLAAEAEKSLGIKTSEPVEKAFPFRLEAMARVYASGQATVLIDSNAASALTVGDVVMMGSPANALTTGVVVRIERQFEQSLGQAEALIEFAPAERFIVGTSVSVAFEAREAKVKFAVPEASVLQTGDGHFVFVANGEHFTRTRVKPGVRTDGWVEIADGLLAGNIIVTNGVQSLRCIELQATKAGVACCPVDHK